MQTTRLANLQQLECTSRISLCKKAESFTRLKAQGSRLKAVLRPLGTVGASREDSHALVTQLRPDDEVAHVPVARGSVSVHSERVVHGSGPNLSPAWRRAYVLARTSACARNGWREVECGMCPGREQG